MTTKKESKEKTNCINYESSICGILICDTCGMNPEKPENSPTILESSNIIIRKFSNINDSFKGLFFDIIENPFETEGNQFLKFKDLESGEIVHVGITKDLERITENHKGKIISLCLSEITKLKNGQTFKRFTITIY